MENELKILDILPWGIIQLDQNGQILFFNRRASELTGLSPETVLGKIYHDVFKLPIALNQEKQSRGWVIHGSRGEALLCSFLPLEDDPGDAAASGLLILEEIGEKKDTLERLLAQERLLGVKELGSTVAHKINQALQVVLGYASLLIVDLSPDDQYFEFFANIIQQMENVRKITQKISNISCYAVTERPDGQRMIDLDSASIS